MNIRFKITLFTSLFLMVMVGILTFFSVQNIRVQGDERIQNYRDSEVNKVRAHLKDLVTVAYETVDHNYKNLSDLHYLSRFYERKLHDVIQTGETIIRRHQRLVREGKVSIETAKNNAKNEISELRYDNGTGYIWINSTASPFPTMIMHPTVPTLDGTVLNDPKYNNALGQRKNLFTAAVDITNNGNNDGFIDYLWPKPTPNGLTEKTAKLSYVRRFDEWDWILGTGIYLDDAKQEIENRIKESIKTMRYANGTGYFWINDNSLPYPKMIMHPTIPALDGTILNNAEFNNAQGINKNLFTAFAEITQNSEGEGFVDYLWPKPTPSGLTAKKPKESYVRLHRPSGWIIGSGVYINSIDEAVIVKKKEMERQISELIVKNISSAAVFIAVAIMGSFLFANTLASPIKRLTEATRDISLGNNLLEPIHDTQRKDEIGELARSVDRLKISVRIMMGRIVKK